MKIDYSDEIMAYLREHKGKCISVLAVSHALTKRVKYGPEATKLRGAILGGIKKLSKEKKVVYYQWPYEDGEPPMRSCPGKLRDGRIRKRQEEQVRISEAYV